MSGAANRFAWEDKKKRGDLDAAYRQLLLYAGPPAIRRCWW